ncbi:MAG: T9SS type A sorting domain-containing protein, partial [Flavobacteriales bacterium]|nr:T9SS type A sorting domain-containing protein [Flavobacteriales bacterium]
NEMADPMHEPFNGQNEFNRWNTVNYEGNASYWHWNGSVGHNAAGSAMLNGSNTYTLVQDLFASPEAYLADVDLLVTPNLALPFANNLNVSFWYAYSTQSSTTTDVTEQLRVYASSNCGQTWLLRETLEGGDLVTAGVRSAGYTPAGDEWREASFTLPSSFAGSQVRLKFEFTSSLASNDLFIDDINIGASNVGIAEVGLNGNLGLMPNPATNHLTVMVDLAGSDKGTLTFMDMTGRTIHTEAVQAGVQEMQFDLEKMGLSRGVYLVQLKHANGQRTGRLVVR